MDIQFALAVIWAFHQEEGKKYLPDKLCRRIEDFENVHGVISATCEKLTYVQDGKLAKIVPDDGTAPTTFTSSSSSYFLLKVFVYVHFFIIIISLKSCTTFVVNRA